MDENTVVFVIYTFRTTHMKYIQGRFGEHTEAVPNITVNLMSYERLLNRKYYFENNLMKF
jgi:hypothetical protein